MRRLLTQFGLFLCFASPTAVIAQTTSPDPIAEARRMLEEERAAEALQLLKPLADRDDASPEVLFLLSNAYFVLGDTSTGRLALDRSIARDPSFREAWITRAALDLAEGQLEQALSGFRTAQRLDPTAADNEINLGATYAIMGDLGNASRQFNSYLSRNRSDTMAYYLVAKNYAMASQWELTVQHLRAAIQLDEKTRRLARRDPVFGPISDYEPFRALLATDTYQPAPGSHLRTESFDEAYDGGHGILLRAVLNALQFSGRPFDPNVEVTDQWALIWSELRIKLTNSPSGGGRLEFSAPATSYHPEQWTRQTDELVGWIREQLARLKMRRR